MSYSIKLIALVFLFQLGCKSSENTSEEKKDMPTVSEVKIEAITRGKKEEYVIDQKEFSYHSNSMGNQNIKKIKQTIDEDQWEKLTNLIASVNFERINSIEAPSKNFQFDGDLATTLRIIISDTTYTSSTFDKKNPPKEIAELVNYIYSFDKD